MKIFFNVKENQLLRQNNQIVTSFSENINHCVFKCEKPLGEIYKYALFIDAIGNQKIVDLGFGEKVSCIIPENMTQTNYFSVSVFGGDRFTTTQEKIIIERSGFNTNSAQILESDNIDKSSMNIINDEEEHRRFFDRDYSYRHNRFEIQEHPYY